MKVAVALVLVALAGCGERREPKVSGSDMYELREHYPGMTEACREKIRFGGFEAWPREVASCFKLTQPRHWTGVLARGFERSEFCAARTADCPDRGNSPTTWVEFSPGAAQAIDLDNGVFAVEFVGRRTQLPGHFGHTSSYDHYMIVDRLVSAKRLSASTQ